MKKRNAITDWIFVFILLFCLRHALQTGACLCLVLLFVALVTNERQSVRWDTERSRSVGVLAKNQNASHKRFS